jgi:hypothetical protein
MVTGCCRAVRWALAVSLAAAGCGGKSAANGALDGGGQPGSDAGPGSGTSGGPWLTYTGGGVFAVDASAPSAAAVSVQAVSAEGLRIVQRGTYVAATGQVSAIETHAALWIAAGKIWRASAAAGATPSPAQVSSETSIGDPSPLSPTPNHLCDTAVVNDWANPDDSRFFYTLAGSDKACGGADDVVKTVRLGTAASEAPVAVAGKRIAPVQSPSTGAITGWLLIDGANKLVRTDAAFANPVTLVASAGFAFLVGRTASQMLLLIQSGTRSAVQRFDPGTGALDPTALFTLPGGSFSTVGPTAQDGTAVYIVAIDGNTFAYSLHRLPLDASQADSAVQMTAETGRTVVGPLLLTANKVAFLVRTSGNDSLVAAGKTAAGTAPAPALGTVAPAGTSLTTIGSAADKVYVNLVGAGGRTAQAIDEGGAAVVAQANAQWTGLADAGGASTAVLASGLSASGGYGGATLSTVVAATGAAGISLGTLPADINTMDRLRFAGAKGLLRGFTKDASGGTYGEALFVDLAAAGSLLRVTSTPAISESVP